MTKAQVQRRPMGKKSASRYQTELMRLRRINEKQPCLYYFTAHIERKEDDVHAPEVDSYLFISRESKDTERLERYHRRACRTRRFHNAPEIYNTNPMSIQEMAHKNKAGRLLLLSWGPAHVEQ